MSDENKAHGRDLVLGSAIAVGTGIGTAIFAGSDNPVWIGIGAAAGVVCGLLWQRRR
jgi:hypothetical protein